MELQSSSGLQGKTDEITTPVEVLTFHVAGVKYRPPDVIESMASGEEVILRAEPTNQYDPFAIQILDQKSSESIGYVPKKNTWILHLLRKARVPLRCAILVNLDLRPEEQILARVWFQGQADAAFDRTAS